MDLGLSGLVLILLVLVVQIWLVSLTNKIAKSAGANETPKLAAPALSAATPVVQSGIEEETVAVISAAIYSFLNATPEGKNTTYVIKSISRATAGRPAWGFAGMQHNTRPF